MQKVDIDIDTYTISPSAVASKITDRTSAILSVHTFGNPCAVEELEDIVRNTGISLFFDSAHAFGSRHGGKYLGGFGEAEVFSLSATKLLPCGEGGVITTNSDSIFRSILDRRNYGFMVNSRDCANMGLNGKITEFSAILGIKEIDSIDVQVQKRNQIAQNYCRAMCDMPGIGFQRIKSNDVSTYKDFTIVIDSRLFGLDRNILKRELQTRGIETDAYFSPAVHQMQYFRKWPVDKPSLTNTEILEKKILSLPIYTDLKDDEFQYIIQAIQEIYNSYAINRTKAYNKPLQRTRTSRVAELRRYVSR